MTPALDATLVQLLVNGGFASLFVWLLITTRKESADRETRLLAIIDKCGTRLEEMAHAMAATTDILRRIEANLSEYEKG